MMMIMIEIITTVTMIVTMKIVLQRFITAWRSV